MNGFWHLSGGRQIICLPTLLVDRPEYQTCQIMLVGCGIPHSSVVLEHRIHWSLKWEEQFILVIPLYFVR